jgi:hypothetical protein
MHLTLGIAFQSASGNACDMEKAQQHLWKAKKIWEAHAPKVGLPAAQPAQPAVNNTLAQPLQYRNT